MLRRVRLAFLLFGSLTGVAVAQIASNPGAGTEGQRASAASARSDAALLAAEREAAKQRRADEERYRRRDRDMRRSLGSICSGC